MYTVHAHVYEYLGVVWDSYFGLHTDMFNVPQVGLTLATGETSSMRALGLSDRSTSLPSPLSP